MKYIIACGNGGCWSGYNHAIFIEAENEKSAKEKGFEWVFKMMSELSNKIYYNIEGDLNYIHESGFSYGIFEFKDNIKNSVGGRLKQSAIIMLEKGIYDEL